MLPCRDENALKNVACPLVQHGGLEVNEAKRLRDLEAENAKLKRMLADKLLEVESMKDVLSKKW